MAEKFDVCVLGGGIVGHTLALLLARERLRVGLVSKAVAQGNQRDDVRAYALNHQSRELLEGLRCWPDDSHATAVLDMHVQEAGAARVHFNAAGSGAGALAWIVDVPALESQLAQALRFEPRIVLLAGEVPAALTVVCEGRSSAARTRFGVEQDLTPYAQSAIAARVRCEMAHQQAAHQWFATGDILGLLPLDGAMGNTMALVWSVDDRLRDDLLACSAESFAQRLQLASSGQLGRMELVSERQNWPLQMAVARQWSGTDEGRAWVLAGDAAHVVHPMAGQGLNLGLADAQELAAQVHARDYWRPVDDRHMLRRYERARKADALTMATATDGLQQLFARPGGGWHRVRNWGMRGFDRSDTLKRWVARRAMGIGFGATSHTADRTI